jgi:uroporphyrinogen-III synthase
MTLRASPPDAVLITRPEPGAGETAARIRSLGLVPIVAPVLEIRPLPMSPPSGRMAAVLLASGNAVDALPAVLHALPVLTVGSATARRAKQAGFADVTSADGDAVALATLVQARFRPREGTLLLAAGRGQSLALAASLREAGFRVARRVAYAAVPVPRLPDAARAALLDQRTRTVLFFSAETTRHFMRLVRAAGLADTLRSRDAITIGGRASMALKDAHWARVRVASQPTQDEMLALLR